MASDQKIRLIADYLDRQVADSGITDGRIWQDLAMSMRTFYRLKPEAVVLQNKRALERQKTIEDTKTSETIEAVKSGLKSKTERVLLLQKQVEDIQLDLNAGILVDYFFIGGKLQKVNKEMNAETKAYLRKTIKDIQAEISKIEGDYAPIKAAQTDKEGNNVALIPVINIYQPGVNIPEIAEEEPEKE